MQFELLGKSGRARRGRLSFERGVVETPAFMPVGTYASVKSMRPEQVAESGAQILLANTFHLMLRPGTDVIRAHGDLHDFMNWSGPILTDSGGFQVFSLGELRKITEQGVHFRSPVNGDKVFLGPEQSMAVQRALGSDIVMIFDECTPYPADEDVARRSRRVQFQLCALDGKTLTFQFQATDIALAEHLLGMIEHVLGDPQILLCDGHITLRCL